MSETTRFLHYRTFPFCLTNEVPPDDYDYVGGLTLTQIMQVWWSMETIAMDVTGDPNGGIAAGLNININAPPNIDSVPIPNSLISSDDLAEAIAPVNRICVTSDYAASFLFEDEYAPSIPRTVTLTLKVIIDPDDADAFAIAYKITAECRGEFDAGAVITSPLDGAYRFTGTPEFTGIIDFGGIEFNWVGGPVFYTTASPENFGSWQTGGTDFTITVIPSFFTYPAP